MTEDKIDVEAIFIAQLRMEQEQELRATIRRTINNCAEQRNIPYGLLWTQVYEAMIRTHNLDFTGCRVKMDAVQKAGLLGEMSRIVNAIVASA